MLGIISALLLLGFLGYTVWAVYKKKKYNWNAIWMILFALIFFIAHKLVGGSGSVTVTPPTTSSSPVISTPAPRRHGIERKEKIEAPQEQRRQEETDRERERQERTLDRERERQEFDVKKYTVREEGRRAMEDEVRKQHKINESRLLPPPPPPPPVTPSQMPQELKRPKRIIDF